MKTTNPPRPRRRPARAAAALAATVALASAARALPSGPGEAAPKIGYVAAVHGAWTIDDGSSVRPVLLSMPVTAQATVTPPERPGPGDHISVLMNDGQRLDRRCDLPRDCTRPATLPRPPRDNWAVRIMNAARQTFTRNPNTYVLTISRGSRLSEAVAAAGPGGARLAGVLPAEPERYELTLRPLTGPDAASGEALGPFTVEWDAARTATLPPEVGPGLYEVTTAETPKTPPMTAWLLVRAPGRRAVADSAAFATAVEVTRGWSARQSDAVSRSFLRAYLHHLSLQP